MPLSNDPLLATLVSVNRDLTLTRLAAAANSVAMKFVRQFNPGHNEECYFAGLSPERAKAEIKELIQTHELDSQKIDAALTGMLRSNRIAQKLIHTNVMDYLYC